MKYRLVLRQTDVGCAYREAHWRRRTSRVLRRYTLRIYAKPGSIHYTSRCTRIVSGRRAWIDTLNGRDFYPLTAEIGLTPFAGLGLRLVEVGLSRNRICAASCGPWATLSTCGGCAAASGWTPG